MPRKTDLLTISLETKLLRKMRQEARRRETSLSALLRDAFTVYTEGAGEIYQDQELTALLKADELPVSLQRDLKKHLQRHENFS